MRLNTVEMSWAYYGFKQYKNKFMRPTVIKVDYNYVQTVNISLLYYQ